MAIIISYFNMWQIEEDLTKVDMKWTGILQHQRLLLYTESIERQILFFWTFFKDMSSQHQSFNFWYPRFIRAYIPHFPRDHSVLNPHVMFRADSHGIRWHRSVLHIPCVLRIFSARLPARFPHGMVPRDVLTYIVSSENTLIEVILRY